MSPSSSLPPEIMKDKNWLEITTKLLLPVILAGVGFWIPYKTHQSDLSRQEAEKSENTKRQQADAEENQKRIEFERETGFVRMLVSDNDDEQQLAIALITAVPPNKRNEQVTAALTSLCAGSQKPKLKGRSCDAVNSSDLQMTQRQPEVAQSSDSDPKVYIQIASEDQRADAEKLRSKLAQDSFRAEGIQLVKPPLATVHTYVRFFSASGAVHAARVTDDMNALNYKAVGVQDFSAYTDKPLPSLEIWIGSSQGKL